MDSRQIFTVSLLRHPLWNATSFSNQLSCNCCLYIFTSHVTYNGSLSQELTLLKTLSCEMSWKSHQNEKLMSTASLSSALSAVEQFDCVFCICLRKDTLANLITYCFFSSLLFSCLPFRDASLQSTGGSHVPESPCWAIKGFMLNQQMLRVMLTCINSFFSSLSFWARL